jgi:SpoU rRNA methylase family enzyme
MPQPLDWSIKGLMPRCRQITCMAANDEVVVTADCDGALQVLRMDTALRQGAPSPDEGEKHSELAEPQDASDGKSGPRCKSE